MTAPTLLLLIFNATVRRQNQGNSTGNFLTGEYLFAYHKRQTDVRF